jgi:hypothetical protein
MKMVFRETRLFLLEGEGWMIFLFRRTKPGFVVIIAERERKRRTITTITRASCSAINDTHLSPLPPPPIPPGWPSSVFYVSIMMQPVATAAVLTA